LENRVAILDLRIVIRYFPENPIDKIFKSLGAMVRFSKTLSGERLSITL
jgi:hypothetical protein